MGKSGPELVKGQGLGGVWMNRLGCVYTAHFGGPLYDVSSWVGRGFQPFLHMLVSMPPAVLPSYHSSIVVE